MAYSLPIQNMMMVPQYQFFITKSRTTHSPLYIYTHIYSFHCARKLLMVYTWAVEHILLLDINYHAHLEFHSRLKILYKELGNIEKGMNEHGDFIDDILRCFSCICVGIIPSLTTYDVHVLILNITDLYALLSSYISRTT